MKKKAASILLILMLVIGTAATAFAVERLIVPDMTFGGDAITLSLDEAVNIMQTTGSSAETAALNKTSDEAVAKGYSESADSLSDMLAAYAGAGISYSSMAESQGITELNENITKLRRDFAKGQLDANYQAEMNKIEATTIETYYGVLQAEENLRVAKESLINQQKIYDNTMKKFKLGTVAKIDTLTAESDLLGAKNQVASAETVVNSAKMNLNMLLGFDLMQKVTLTDTLKLVGAPDGTLTEFIEGALDNRNEIKGAAFAADIQELLLNNLKYRYPSNSSTYLKQQVAFEQAQKQADDAPMQIEMDIRVKYMDLADQERAVQAAEATLANAKEGYRLATITYDAGMNTLTDVQSAQIRSFQAGQALAAAITDYDLAVYAFHHAISVGTTRLPL
jgi:hypothetical protein